MDSRKNTTPFEKGSIAFLPFTFGGIARFGYAKRVYLLTVEIIVALFCSLCVVWFFCGTYFPVVGTAIDALPDGPVKIANGFLIWEDERDGVLAQSPKLSIVVRAYKTSPRLGRESDLALELSEQEVRLYSFGRYTPIPYGQKEFSLERQRAIPWWEAWMGPIIFWVWFISFFSLIFIWQCFSFLYMFIIKGIAWIARRKITWSGSYTMAGATLMLGAILMGIAILGYGADYYGLPGLVIATIIHFLPAWIFLLICPFLLPRLPKRLKNENSFSAHPSPAPSPSATSTKPQHRKEKPNHNPFAAPQNSTEKKSIFSGKNKKNPFA